MEEAFLEDWSLTLSDAIDPVALLNKIIEKNTLNLLNCYHCKMTHSQNLRKQI